MKKIIAGLSGALIAFSMFAGCSTTKVTLADNSPIALVSVISNSAVPWVADDPEHEEEAPSDGLLTNAVNRLIDGKNPELVTAIDRLDYASDSFFQIIPELTGCQVMDKDTLLSSDAYVDLRASFFNVLTSTKLATGYKDLTTFGGKHARMFLRDINAKGAVVLTFTFEKKLLNGNKWNGECVALVTLKAKVIDEKGKEIINKTFTSQSDTRIKIRSHSYDKDALVNTINPEIDNVLRVFAVEYMDGAAEKAEAEAAPVAEAAPSIPATALPKISKPAKEAEAAPEAEEALKAAE